MKSRSLRMIVSSTKLVLADIGQVWANTAKFAGRFLAFLVTTRTSNRTPWLYFISHSNAKNHYQQFMLLASNCSTIKQISIKWDLRSI